jgi:mannitol/fructose-specific phosphotransferase system IIA component (Ntr-type)
VRVVEAARQLIANMSAFGLEISESQICVIPKGASKQEALDTLITAVGTNPVVTDVEAFRAAVYEREGIMSTGIGEGIAIPHVRIPEITEATLGVGIAPAGIDFDTLDNKPVNVLVLFATPAGSDKEYLSLLAQVMLSLRNKELFDGLVACKTPAEVYAVLNG